MSATFAGAEPCPRCHSLRPPGATICRLCHWRFGDPLPAEGAPAGDVRLIVEVSPDPFERRQAARWVLAIVEIGVLTLVAGLLGGFSAGAATNAIMQAIGADAFGILVATSVTAAIGFLLGGYGMLLRLSR